MSRKIKKNIAHSIFQLLLNRAKENKEDVNHLLSRYGMERFLYRLSISPNSDRFILKGASLFLVWKVQNYRVTRDADLLCFGNPDLKLLENTFRDICGVTCSQDDGMTYLADSLRATAIREDKEYDGVRITLCGFLNQAKIPIQIDIGFGDAITPDSETIEYPTLFDGPAPRMKAYPRYTLVAEKLEAMIKFGIANSRIKDFFDIWLLSKLFGFDGVLLGQAITNTFNRRRTPLPETIPFAFTASFYNDSQKQMQWAAFVRKLKPDVPNENLASVITDLSEFILPVLEELNTDAPVHVQWLPGQGWVS